MWASVLSYKVLAWAAVTNYQNLIGLKRQTFSHDSGGQKFKIKHGRAPASVRESSRTVLLHGAQKVGQAPHLQASVVSDKANTLQPNGSQPS